MKYRTSLIIYVLAQQFRSKTESQILVEYSFRTSESYENSNYIYNVWNCNWYISITVQPYSPSTLRPQSSDTPL